MQAGLSVLNHESDARTLRAGEVGSLTSYTCRAWPTRAIQGELIPIELGGHRVEIYIPPRRSHRLR